MESYPVSYPEEMVAIQVDHDPTGAQKNFQRVNYTTVKGVINPVSHPRDYIVWSICCLVYYNPCCLSVLALYYSVKARDQKLRGDMDGAKHSGKIAAKINISIMILFFIGIIIFFVYLSAINKMLHGFLEQDNKNIYSHG